MNGIRDHLPPKTRRIFWSKRVRRMRRGTVSSIPEATGPAARSISYRPSIGWRSGILVSRPNSSTDRGSPTVSATFRLCFRSSARVDRRHAALDELALDAVRAGHGCDQTLGVGVEGTHGDPDAPSTAVRQKETSRMGHGETTPHPGPGRARNRAPSPRPVPRMRRHLSGPTRGPRPCRPRSTTGSPRCAPCSPCTARR